MTERSGYRGYIASRPIMGERTPQHVQNLVVRDYARRKGLSFLLSATEYAMTDCFMVLEQVLRELPQIEGIIGYSLFMLPERATARRAIWTRVLDGGARLHFALEGLAVADEAGIRRIEDIWLVRGILPSCPAGLQGIAS
jgi:sporadic carbohydrate cluster protein (TIGR04323 family)